MRQLNEEQTRAKAIELFDGMNQMRMDVWISSGITAGALDRELVEKALREEIHNRSHEVQQFWLGECNCDGHLN